MPSPSKKQAGVWTVTSGSYSSYRVHAAFPTRKLAEEVIANKRDKWDEYDIGYLPLYDVVPERRMLHRMSVTRRFSGGWLEPEAWATVTWPWDEGYPQDDRARVKAYPTKGKVTQIVATGTVRAAVQQAFSDKWAEIKAKEEGIA